MASSGAASRGGCAHVLHLKKGGGVLSAEDREHYCMEAISQVLEYYRCDIAANISEDAQLWAEAREDERLN